MDSKLQEAETTNTARCTLNTQEACSYAFSIFQQGCYKTLHTSPVPAAAGLFSPLYTQHIGERYIYQYITQHAHQTYERHTTKSQLSVMLTERVSLKLVLFRKCFSFLPKLVALSQLLGAISDMNKVPQFFKCIHGLWVKTPSKLQNERVVQNKKITCRF